ncbi:hypothetical protein [Mucilaginibacter sp.]|uniref:hypothetical protein n=1 Tax=Mucilaginibacter sp. TaxID=1882438 RepID=UPI003D09E007
MKTLKIKLFAFLMAAASLVNAQGKIAEKNSEVQKNKETVIKFNTEYWQSGNVEINKELLADNYVSK